MTAIEAIVWTCVAIFVATAVVTFLALIGKVQLGGGDQDEHKRYLRLLVKTLVVEVAIIAVGVFADYATGGRGSVQSAFSLPVKDLMLAERGNRTISDGNKRIYLRVPDVSRANRFADLVIDVRDDFATSKSLRLAAGVPQVVEIGNQKYQLIFSQMGQVDADPKERHAQTDDFVLLSVSRAK
jgi:hypothetical protein